MRGKIPNTKDLRRTLMGILQSTAFLTTNAFAFSAFACLLRHAIGRFYFPTVTYLPAFLASILAIAVERPSRRGLLSLYVANVATESYWRMLVSRGLVKSVPGGQVLIFGVSAAICSYFYKTGLHHEVTQGKDGFFDSIRFVVGKHEEFDYELKEEVPALAVSGAARDLGNRQTVNRKSDILAEILRTYNATISRLKKTMQRHKACPHHHSCLHYVLQGGAKLYCVGLGIQLSLSVLFQVKKIIKSPSHIKSILMSKELNKIALFLGGYCTIYRAVSCILRHVRDKDAPEHAIPAGLLASLSFYSYPNVSVALYIMWKTLQFVYNLGHARGYLPKVPGFQTFLYCAFTATLFHVAMFEPTNLRSSYFKFLEALSGGRIAFMARGPLDVYGLETSRQLQEMLLKTKSKAQMKFLF